MERSDKRMIFQLGTNNWQTQNSSAPGSGIMHEALHVTCNGMENTSSWSIWPSRTQYSEGPDHEVFKLDHDIPICESVSPVSSYRWHTMPEEDFLAYRKRLGDSVYDFMERCEATTGQNFTHALAHHCFLNPIVMKDVLARRRSAGKPELALGVFIHGTAMKMFEHELDGNNPAEFPLRFYPLIQKEQIFVSNGPVHVVFTTSQQQVATFHTIFPEYPEKQIVCYPNGINHHVFGYKPSLTRREVLSTFCTTPYEGSSVRVPGDFDKVVTFVGKFADVKRLDCLLSAAVAYEAWGNKQGKKVATIICGTGPVDVQKEYHDMAKAKGLAHAYFLGHKTHMQLAQIYNVSDLGVFPTWKEAFGLVFIECMACRTPVIGADSGGPKDFVTPEVGMLVPEVSSIDMKEEFTAGLSAGIIKALEEDWKASKGAACEKLALEKYSLKKQCNRILDALDGSFI